jgi:hypothetical protein
LRRRRFRSRKKVERGLVQAAAARIAPIDEAPDLKTRFEAWSRSRDAFHASVAAHPPTAPADHWQKFYYRGVDADGTPGAPGLVERFPALEGLNVHQVMLDPGDALFIPLGWWHQVTALDFSVTLTHTNFRWPNDFHMA